MKPLKLLCVLTILILPNHVFSQLRKIKLSCNLSWDTSDVQLLKSYPLNEQLDSVYFTKIKFYISNFYFKEKDQRISTGDVFLFDMDKKDSYYLTIQNGGNPDSFGFLLGTDSMMNVSGAMEGVLDPSNGMYWTWQSGYINVKIEGELIKSDGLSESFHYHLGGYRYPFVGSKEVLLPLKNVTNEINLSLTLSSFIRKAMKTEVMNIMSPGIKSVELIEMFANSIDLN